MTVDERTKIYNDLTRVASSDDMSTEDKEEYQRDITRRITNLTTQVIEVKNQIERSDYLRSPSRFSRGPRRRSDLRGAACTRPHRPARRAAREALGSARP